MLSEYRKLIKEACTAVRENYEPGKVLLTPYHFETVRPVVKLVAASKPIPHVSMPQIAKPKEVVIPVAPAVAAPAKEEVKASVILPQNDLKQLLKKIAPEMRIVDEIPSDETARKIVENWKGEEISEEVIILFFEETEEEMGVIRNLAHAINTRLKPARVIDGRKMEKEDKWGVVFSSPKLRLILSSPTLTFYPLLMQHYKELKETGKIFLNTTPLYILDSMSSYLKNPTLKISLWQKLSMLL